LNKLRNGNQKDEWGNAAIPTEGIEKTGPIQANRGDIKEKGVNKARLE